MPGFGTTGNGASTEPAVSGDGSKVAYGSEADNLDEPGTDDNDNSDMMTWDRPTACRSQLETAVTAPALTWYLAEGATHSGFDLFYLLQHPSTSEARVRVRYPRPATRAPASRRRARAGSSSRAPRRRASTCSC